MMNSVVLGKPTPFAKWSLILSLLGFFMIGPLGLIPAVICGHMAYSRIKRSTGDITGKGLAKAGLIIGYAGLVFQLLILPALLLPSLLIVRDKAQRTYCAMNLRQINDASRLYAEENHEKFPDDIQQLSKYLPDPRVFICPSSGHKPGNMNAIANWSDYVLVPNRKFGGVDNVLAYSKLECYQGKGGNIAFMDNTIRWCPREEYNRLISNIVINHN